MNPDKRGSGWIVFGLLLMAAAPLLIGYNLREQSRAGKDSESILEQMEILEKENRSDAAPQETAIPDEKQESDGELEIPMFLRNPDMPMPVEWVEGDQYIGKLKIPDLGLTLPVLSEWDDQKVQKAPCRYAGSAYRKDMVIGAHNFDTHFGKLDTLHVGDTIIFTDLDGNSFHYTIKKREILDSKEIDRMVSDDADLTLFTCTIGGANRFTLRCTLQEVRDSADNILIKK